MTVLIYIFGLLFGLCAHVPLFTLKDLDLKNKNKILSKDVVYKMIVLCILNVSIISLIVRFMLPHDGWSVFIAIGLAAVDSYIMMNLINLKYFEPKNGN